MSSDDELLEHARSVLQRGRRHLDPATAVKMRRALDDALTTPERGSIFPFRWLAAGAALAACTAVAIFVARIDGSNGSSGSKALQVIAGHAVADGRSLAMSRGAVVEVKGARLLAQSDVRLELPELEAEALRIDLYEGSMELEVDPRGEVLLVTTPLAEIRVLGTRFSVASSEDRTDVRVMNGVVEVKDLQRKRSIRVATGQRLTVERIVEVAAAAVEPAKEAAAEVDARSPEPRGPAPKARRAKPRIAPKRADAALESANPPLVAPAAPAPVVQIAPVAQIAPAAPAARSEEKPLVETPNAIPEAVEPPVAPKPPVAIEPPVVTPQRAVAPAPLPFPIEELVRRADRARRDGQAKEASALYAEIASHPDGGPFAEEALFREAELLLQTSRLQDSLRTLAEAERRFGRGELAPERSALLARIHLKRGDAKAAAAALGQVGNERSTLEVAMVALEVASALEPSDPCAALRMLSLVSNTEKLRPRADEIDRRVRSRCKKTP